jgi:hypothetical protein
VRTPNIRELYTTEEINFTTFVDPCAQWESNTDANLMANCAADVGPGFTQSELFVELDYPGNPNLNPEKADTFTIGAVVEPAVLFWKPGGLIGDLKKALAHSRSGHGGSRAAAPSSGRLDAPSESARSADLTVVDL